MGWVRRGLVWGPDARHDWAQSHASHPYAVALGGDRYRILFGTRDAANQSSLAWLDLLIPVDAAAPVTVAAAGDTPLLTPGDPGAYDDNGLGMGSVVRTDAGDHLYYMGWNLSVRSPWRNSIGVAVGDVAAPAFLRPYLGPIMDRTPADPFTLSYPWVMRLADDDWRMWYGSNTAWGAQSFEMQHLIKLARSRNGIDWVRSTEPALPFADSTEYAMARPTVIRERDGFAMWFTVRGDHYRIGAAWSADGERWERRDPTHGLDRADAGWDGAMVCYPCVFDHGPRRLLLYNGDGYGRDGFGLAEWSEGQP